MGHLFLKLQLVHLATGNWLFVPQVHPYRILFGLGFCQSNPPRSQYGVYQGTYNACVCGGGGRGKACIILKH